MTEEINITVNVEKLSTLLRSNISWHMNKPLTQELIDTLTKQIIDSIAYFLSMREEIL